MQKIISVALDVPINKLFDYYCDNNNAKTGSRVKVPFGNSTRIGLIVEISENLTKKSEYEVKGIYELLDEIPILSTELLKTSKWAATYYHYPIGQVLFNCMTPIHRKGKAEPKKRNNDNPPNKPIPLKLNDEQLKVSNSIYRDIDKYQVNYLRGVTGSGKTEVYTDLAAKILKNNGQVLIMVPEINLTPQTLTRFQKYLSINPQEYHSNLTPSQKFKVWNACREKNKLIIIGTRSSIFLPFDNLKLIVVDEEHDQSYKQNEKFKYNARDISIVRAKNFDCPIVLGSATPSFESIHNINIKKYKQYKLLNRYFKSK